MLLEFFLFVILLVMFFFSMGDAWIKFISRKTSTAVTFQSKEKGGKKFLPALTFCPWPVYKTKGLHYNQEDYKLNTFDLEEIFYIEALIELKNSSLYSFNETLSIHYGCCHTIKYKVNYKFVIEKFLTLCS
jgi:hypothetical protein